MLGDVQPALVVLWATWSGGFILPATLVNQARSHRLLSGSSLDSASRAGFRVAQFVLAGPMTC